MLRIGSMMATAALLLSWDVSGVTRLQPPNSRAEFPPGEGLPVLPEMKPQSSPTTNQGTVRHINIPDDTDADAAPAAAPPAKAIDGPLQPASRLALVRYVSGEYV